MSWLEHYRLVLLDFDGLLVDSERLHYRAYREMCGARGYSLDLTFEEYCAIAHASSKGLSEMVYTRFPELLKEEPRWEVLYAEKQKAIHALLEAGAATLMPGTEAFLTLLAQTGVNRCVVTHSPLALVRVLREQFPVLDAIPHWITREDYLTPKPHPECYQMAIERYTQDEIAPVIGFEDSFRGLKALAGTRAQPVLIAPSLPTYAIPTVDHYLHFKSLEEIDANSTMA
ncbi:MAG: HAD family phosphatase [Chlamydiia bacterium]|nr:HAD family phosphatase [Chlamydiia bacterium]